MATLEDAVTPNAIGHDGDLQDPRRRDYLAIAAVSFALARLFPVTLVGVAVLRGRDVLHDRGGARLHRLVHAAPLAGAAAVTGASRFSVRIA